MHLWRLYLTVLAGKVPSQIWCTVRALQSLKLSCSQGVRPSCRPCSLCICTPLGIFLSRSLIWVPGLMASASSAYAYLCVCEKGCEGGKGPWRYFARPWLSIQSFFTPSSLFSPSPPPQYPKTARAFAWGSFINEKPLPSVPVLTHLTLHWCTVSQGEMELGESVLSPVLDSCLYHRSKWLKT